MQEARRGYEQTGIGAGGQTTGGDRIFGARRRERTPGDQTQGDRTPQRVGTQDA